MRLPRLPWIIGVVLLATAALAQAQAQACLHTGLESPVEVRRREEALAAARLINSAMGRARVPNQPARFQSWDELAGSPTIASLRGMGGPLGELARKVQWGGSEPLPGWHIHHVNGEQAYAFSLTDTRDPCGFTYVSDDSGTVVEGYPVDNGQRGGLVPIT